MSLTRKIWDDDTSTFKTKNIENVQHMQSSKFQLYNTAAGTLAPSEGDVFTHIKAVGMELGEHCDVTVQGLDGVNQGPFHLEEGNVLEGPFISVTLDNGSGTTNGSTAPSIALWERT